MGSLTLPTTGAVYIETPAFIYTVERHPRYEPLLRPLWQAVQAQTITAVSSELALLETCVMPMRQGDAALLAVYERLLLHTPQIHLLPLTRDILREAARLRASIAGLRTPDALHAATALEAGCTLFVTNDAGFRRVPNLPLAILDDVLVS